MESNIRLSPASGWPGHACAFLVSCGASRCFTAQEVELLARLRPHVACAFAFAHRPDHPRQNPGHAGNGRGRNRRLIVNGHRPERARLTEREEEVLHWLSAGKRDNEIAAILGISPRTVHKHVEHILLKLGVETRTAAARSRVS